MSRLIIAIVLIFSLVHQQSANAPPAAAPVVTRTKACPAGFELVGKQCVATSLLPPNYVCPAGTTLVDGQCSTFRRAARQCSSSYTLSGETCSTTQSVLADFTCANGDLDHSGRTCVKTTHVAPLCPAGFAEQKGQCVRFSLKQKKCPSGYTLQGKECSRTVSYPGSPRCPATFNLDGKTCSKFVPIPTSCPASFVMEGSECVREIPRVPSACPAGFRVVANNCEKPLEYPVRLVCPVGMNLNQNNQCVKSVPVPPTCPAGTVRGSSGQCEIPVAEEPICENGFQLVNEGKKPICKLVTRFPTNPTCTKDFTLVHGKCKKATSIAPSSRCASGTLQNGVCNSQSSTTPSIECPNGFRLTKGSVCIQDVSYDCSQTIQKTVCDMPSFVAQILDQPTSHYPTAGKKLRALYGGDYKQKSAPVASKKAAPVTAAPTKSAGSKSPTCHQVSELIPKTCTKVERAALVTVCLSGATLQGKSCVSNTSTPAQLFCPTGQFDRQSGSCVTIIVVPAQQVCPAGTQKQGKECIQVDTQEVLFVCPAGSQPSFSGKTSGCVIVKDELIHPDRVVLQTPQTVCDIGSKRGNVCADKQVVARDTECPHKTEDRKGRCVKTTPIIAPAPRLETAYPKYVCADEKPANGKTCSAREAVPIDFFCQSGGQLDSDRCVHSTSLIHPAALVSQFPATPVCSKGYALRGDKCFTTVSEPAQKVCPAGFYAYQDGARECVQNHQQVAVCPAGTTQSKSGCTKTSYAPARVTEVKECTKGTSGCH